MYFVQIAPLFPSTLNFFVYLDRYLLISVYLEKKKLVAHNPGIYLYIKSITTNSRYIGNGV